MPDDANRIPEDEYDDERLELPEDTVSADDAFDVPGADVAPGDEDVPLANVAARFDEALEALAAYEGDDLPLAEEAVDEALEDYADADTDADEWVDTDAEADEATGDYDDETAGAASDALYDEDDAEPDEPYDQDTGESRVLPPLEPAIDASERVRAPRAESFRRGLRNQVAMLPLALALLALGGFLLARQQDVEDLPDVSDGALVAGMILVAAFTAVWRWLVFGRQERGLLFTGLLVWAGAGTLALLVTGIDAEPDAAEWWPLIFVPVSVALFVMLLLERARDARLLLVIAALAVAGTLSYLYTSDRLDEQVMSDAADYWPLLISVLGVLLLPLAFRRRTG